MKIIFAGGGTAGHIYPALAIANELKKEYKNFECLFIGREKGMEAKKIPESGYNIKFIEINGLERKKVHKNFALPFIWCKAVKNSKRIISEFNPDVVIGTGGYVSAPVVYSAHKLGIKTLIHEVNSVPGISTLCLAGVADKITVSFEESKSRSYLKNAAVTGNPLRQEIFNISKKQARENLKIDDKPLIVAFGGSLGAKAINDAMKNLPNKEKFNIIWGCGERFYDEYKEFGAIGYINNMDEVLSAADVVITRGGGVLFELTALGKASIIIPSPNVTANHQEKNARALESKNALYVILEHEINKLPEYIAKALQNQKELEEASKLQGKPNATNDIIKIIKQLI